jgi:hypothetical protein
MSAEKIERAERDLSLLFIGNQNRELICAYSQVSHGSIRNNESQEKGSRQIPD